MVILMFTNIVNSVETKSSEPIMSTNNVTSPLDVHNGTFLTFDLIF